MAGLFTIDWTIINEALISFPQDWIEGFVHLDVRVCAAKSKSNYIFESSFRISFFRSFFQQFRAIAEGFTQKGKIRVIAEYRYRH